MADPNPHNQHSSLRESILEHAFLGAVGGELWKRRHYRMEILRAEVDAAGYDIVATVGQITRHIQLKAMVQGGRASWPIALALSNKASGCIVVQVVDKETLAVDHYLFFGDTPGRPLPDITGGSQTKHAKGDSRGVKKVRKDRYQVPKKRFERVDTTAGLVDRLFTGACGTTRESIKR